MSSVDLFLEDEGQQHGNMEEAASVPEHRLLVWRCGLVTTWWSEKEQRIEIISEETGSAMPNSVTQAHDLGGIAMRYLDCHEGSFLGKSDNSWKPTPLPSTLQLCRLGTTLLEKLHMLFSRNPSCCFCHSVDGLTRRKRRTS